MKNLQSYERGHRRGTIFGLTVAEVLIIILFLLLLLMLILSADESRELKAKNTALKQTIAQLHEVALELQDLRVVSREQLPQNEVLISPFQEWQPPSGEEDDQTVEAYLDHIDEVIDNLDENIKSLNANNKSLNTNIQSLETRIQKGENPPCWYLVDEESKKEKAIKIFDIAIYDDYIVVRQRDISELVEEHGELPHAYVDEYQSLGLERIPFGTRMKLRQFQAYFEPLYELGKNAQVRSYSCKFFVDVWDKTSTISKTRWQQAFQDYVQGFFGTYVVKKDPWLPEEL